MSLSLFKNVFDSHILPYNVILSLKWTFGDLLHRLIASRQNLVSCRQTIVPLSTK